MRTRCGNREMNGSILRFKPFCSQDLFTLLKVKDPKELLFTAPPNTILEIKPKKFLKHENTKTYSISFRAMKSSHAIHALENLYTQERMKMKRTNNVLVYNKNSFVKQLYSSREVKKKK